MRLVPLLPILTVAASLAVYSSTPAPARCTDREVLDNTLIQAAGSTPIYFLSGGRKYGIQNPVWINKNKYKWEDVHVLEPSRVAAIPSGYELLEASPIPGTPSALEDRLVSAPDLRVYLIKKGQRHWILNGQWIAESRYAGQAAIPVSEGELRAFEPGPEITYTTIWDQFQTYLLTVLLFAFVFLASTPTDGSSQFWKVVKSGRDTLCLLTKRNSWRLRAILLVIFVVAIIMRAPFLLRSPRFWAEEGTGWFQFASSHSLAQTFFFVYPPSGYLNLLANLASIFSSLTATQISLEYAPAATTLIALFIQVLTIAVILFVQSRLFDSLWKAVMGCLIVLFASTATPEIWLNTINSMSYLGAITLLLLFQDTFSTTRWGRWAVRSILLLCGLSSPYAVALLPLFIWTAWRDRDLEKKIHCVILLACFAVEASVVVWSRLAGLGSFAMRGAQVQWEASMVNVFGGHIIRPLLGDAGQSSFLGFSGLYGAWTSASSFPHQPNSSLLLGGWVSCILVIMILWRLKGKAPHYSVNSLLIGAFIIFSGLTCLTSLNGVPLGRYAFMPAMAFLLLVLVNADLSKSRITPYICAIMLSYGLADGIMAYGLQPDPGARDWASEVRIWRTDHTHKLRIWPSFWQERISYSGLSGDVGLAAPELSATATLVSLFHVTDIAKITDTTADGAVDVVNGVTSPAADNRASPVHIQIQDGVAIQGWMVMGAAKSGKTYDEVYAVVNGVAVKANKMDRNDVGTYFKNEDINRCGFQVLLGSSLLRKGLQPVDFIGVYRKENKKARFRSSTFIFAE